MHTANDHSSKMLKSHGFLPDGKMKFLRAGSCSSILSTQVSNKDVADASKAARAILSSDELSKGVATADPTSSSLDCIVCNYNEAHV